MTIVGSLIKVADGGGGGRWVVPFIVPLIASVTDILNKGHLFTDLSLVTENTTVNPNPDFFNKAHPKAIEQKVRDNLDKRIIPTEKTRVPIAPNFFLEAKAPRGSLEIA